MKTAFVILAAGKGERLGGQPKQFRPLGGKALWQWSLDRARALAADGLVDEIVLVLPSSGSVNEIEPSLPDGVVAIAGGATRALSVREALRASSCDAVLLHEVVHRLAIGDIKLVDIGEIPLMSRLRSQQTQVCAELSSAAGDEDVHTEKGVLKSLNDGWWRSLSESSALS